MKVLKGAAVIVGAVVGAVVGGIVAGPIGAVAGAALFAGGTAAAVGALGAKPSGGGSQTKWKADPYAGLPYIMGRTLTSGNIVYRRGSGGNNDYEQFATVLSIGPIQSIDTTFLNKTTVNFDGSGAATGTYNGYVWQRSQLGAQPEAAALTFGAGAAPGWTAQHRLSGLAATTLSFKYDAKNKNGLTSEPTPGWIVHGVKVYDPRLDSTYPGGAGACRALQEQTYVWSENPHLHALTWALGRWQNGVRVAGIGAPLAQIDVPAFVEGANLDDARGWKLGGQVVTRPDTLWNSLKAMLQAGGAQPVLAGGMISCVNHAPRVSLATITREDIVGECSFSGTQPRRNRINGIIPQYRSEAHDWEMVAASAVSVADYVALDGDERTKEVPYPLVQQVAQVAQLAAYDVCDAREAGPGSIPLKPWWLNYRVGDCVTFQPEDDLSIKVTITGRSIEAQSGVVTYDVRGETDAKHAYALGATTTAPPIVSLAYSTAVAAPGANDWTLTGTALAANGASIPALHLAGAVGNASADAVVFEYRLAGTQTWSAGGTEPAATTDKAIVSVTPNASYEVAVSYRVRGVVGDRLVLGPVTAGQLSVSRAAYQLVSRTVAYPLTSDSGSITIAAFTGVLDDGRSINFPAGSVTGLAAGASFAVLWDLANQKYVAAAAPATAQLGSNAYVALGWQSTAAADGTYPADPTPPPGYGGSGSYRYGRAAIQ